MKLIMERWNRFMVEADFVDSPDEDQPGKNALIVFSPQESYTVAGNTHGGLSHTIKHYKEFEPSEVATALSQALAQAKESNNFAIQNLKTGATVTGDEAKNSNSANENAMLNTFDMINDKLQNGQSLTQEEEQIKSFLEPINTKYQSLVDTYMSQATDVDNLQDPAQIKQLLDAGKLIKFVGTYSGSPNKRLVQEQKQRNKHNRKQHNKLSRRPLNNRKKSVQTQEPWQWVWQEVERLPKKFKLKLKNLSALIFQ